MNFDKYIQLPKINITAWKALEWLEYEFDTTDELSDFVIELLCHNDCVLERVKVWIEENTQK